MPYVYVSLSELESVFADYVRTAELLGVDVSEYHMITGSKTQGQSYRVRNKGANALGVRSDGWIGDTRSEAATTLRNVTWGMRHARQTLLGLPIYSR